MYYIQQQIASDEIGDEKDAAVEMGSLNVLEEEVETMLPPQVVRDASSREAVPLKL